MKKFIAATLAIAMLAGCAPRGVWMKDGITPAEAESDTALCRYEAQKATGGYYIQNSMVDGYEMAVRQNQIIGSCFQSKGYYFVQTQ